MSQYVIEVREKFWKCVHRDRLENEGLTFLLVKNVKTGRSLERELLSLANISLQTLFIAAS